MRYTVLQAFELGWCVIPVMEDKRPYFKWQEYQVSKPDKDMITGWHKKYNPPAWAVITGEISGIIVLDFDGELGRIALEKTGLEPHVQTGGGGFHVYVEHPGFKIKTLNSKSKRELGARYPGVDIRGDGGYAIFCGKNSSGTYKWLREPVPYPISAIPDDLRACLGLNAPDCDDESDIGEAETCCNATPDDLVNAAVRRSTSGRNDAGFLLACQLRDNGLTEADAKPIMLQYQAKVPSINTKGQTVPYTVEESLASLTQAYSSPPREPVGSVKIVHGNKSLSTNTASLEPKEAPVIARQWPKTLSSAALRGLGGEFIELVNPHTESDLIALLVSYFVAFGNIIGRSAHFVAEADRHYMNLFAVQVGLSAKGRKGSSLGQVMRMFREMEPDWEAKCVHSGLSSGEGLIWAVRDAINREEPIREKKLVTGYQTITVDSGVPDKRLLVLESEFASTLRVIGRDGNTLSAVIRNAWDTGDLRILSKNSPACSTGAHISIIGHITKSELLRYLESTEAGNGFGNRFLWICVRRSKVLPDGGQPTAGAFDSHINKLNTAVAFAKNTGEMTRDNSARKLWHKVYPELSEGKPGLLGAMIARAEAQVMRIACIYALLDLSSVVSEEHLLAALEVWRYAEDSARYIFGDSLGDPAADELLRVLRTQDEGLTRTQISNHYGRNRSASDIGRALGVLLEHGLIQKEQDNSGEGRPVEMWRALHTANEINAINEVSSTGEGVIAYNSFTSYPATETEMVQEDIPVSPIESSDIENILEQLSEYDQYFPYHHHDMTPQDMDDIIDSLVGNTENQDGDETHYLTQETSEASMTSSNSRD